MSKRRPARLVVVRHRQKPTLFLRLVNDGRGDATYPLRVVEGKLPELSRYAASMTLPKLLTQLARQGLLNPSVCYRLAQDYEMLDVTLHYGHEPA